MQKHQIIKVQKFIKKSCLSLFLLCSVIFTAVIGYNGILPDEIRVYKGDDLNFDKYLQISQNVKSSGSYDVSLKLFGAVPVKSVRVDEIEEMQVALSGEPFGIKIFTDGVMVVGMTDIERNGVKANPAYKAGIRTGDVITDLDGYKVQSNEDVADVIERSDGKIVTAKVIRNGNERTFEITPEMSDDGRYKIGIWVRDSSAGIGTMTFYSPVDGRFAGLGHAICDVDTGLVLPLESGEIVFASINSVVKGKNGDTGELCGSFCSDGIGRLSINNDNGLYGQYYQPKEAERLITVATANKVQTGQAKILTSTDNSGAKYYDCVIERIDRSNSAEHNMIIRITDEKLLSLTGGIVQGMSGSPIIQNDELVGAVTHVFVNDSAKGYAIFAETMFDEMKSVEPMLRN